MLLPMTPRRSSRPDPLTGRAAALCRAVARADLAEVPVYIVRRGRLPAGRGGDIRCLGITSPYLDLGLKEAIGPSWRGRGPAMLIDDSLPANKFLSTVGHELAHVLTWDRPFLVPLYHSADQARDAVIEGLAEQAGPPEDWHSPAQAITAHGPAFVRAALHVFRRSTECGFRLLLEDVLGAGFTLSPAAAYLDAIGDEPERMARSTFRDIRATPVPAALERLWQRDAAAAVAG